MHVTKKHSIIQEQLVDLYLRLNGYFTSGLIIHSRMWGKQLTEIDKIAVRFPKHLQKDRQVNCSTYFEIPNNIDIVICEVKSKNKKVQFNRSLINTDNLETWEKILDWIGLFSKEQIIKLKSELNDLIQPKENVGFNTFRSVHVNTDNGIVTIRPIIFSPERNDSQEKQIKYVHGPEIIDFIWGCLCPDEKRTSCSTKYDFNSWGNEFSSIVKIFKDAHNNGKKIKTINEIYDKHK